MSCALHFSFEHKEWASPINTKQRTAFRAHLAKVAKAIKAIERHDEYGDSVSKAYENAAIEECLSLVDMLEQATIDAREAGALLTELLLLASKAGNKPG